MARDALDVTLGTGKTCRLYLRTKDPSATSDPVLDGFFLQGIKLVAVFLPPVTYPE